MKAAGCYGKGNGENMMSEFAVIVNNMPYFAEACDCMVNVYVPDLNFEFVFGGMGSNQGQMIGPEAADAKAGSAGNMWSCDHGNNRIQKYSSDGKFVMQFKLQIFAALFLMIRLQINFSN